MWKRALVIAIGCCAAACTATPVVDLGEKRFVRFGAVHDVMLGSPLDPGDSEYRTEERPRTVTLGEFEMSKHLVTVSEYALFLNSTSGGSVPC